MDAILSVSHDELVRREKAYQREAQQNPTRRGGQKRAPAKQNDFQMKTIGIPEILVLFGVMLIVWTVRKLWARIMRITVFGAFVCSPRTAR